MPRIRAENIARHKEVTRALIVDAALGLFAASGYERTTLGAIADLARVPRSSIYEYFPNKRAILGAVIEDRIPPLLNDWFAGIPDGNALERLEGLYRTTFRMMLEHPREAALVVGPGLRMAGPDSQMQDMVALVTQALAEMCREGITDGSFAAADPDHLAAAVGDLLIGGVTEMLESTDPSGSRDAILETRLRMLRVGVRGEN
jgi:AcrR family transcriptional regulator